MDRSEDRKEQIKRQAEQMRVYRTKNIYNSMIESIVASKLTKETDHVFLEYLADAIVTADGCNSPLYELAGEHNEGENVGEARDIRGAGHSLQQIKEAMCQWIVCTIQMTDADISAFGINTKVIQKKAEKQFEDEQAKQ